MNQFKDKMFRWRTLSLFKESAAYPKEHVLYTFEEARKLYIECNDPTGYTFATTHLGGWKHWLLLKGSSAIAEKIDEWEQELEVKLRAEAVGNMIKLSIGDKGYQANKFLVDGGWVQKKAGRPTKESIKRETKVRADMYAELEESVDLRKH